MAALVPLAGPRYRLRYRRGISATSDTGECKGRTFSHKKTGTKRKRSNAALRQNPELSEEIIVTEILVRLPVKSLVRFKSVCKACRATISDPSFIRAQLQWSASKWEQDPCFIISPHTMDYLLPGDPWPSISDTHIRFYKWRHVHAASNNTATFVHGEQFGSYFDHVHYLMHCDGLVLVATDIKLVVFNLATRDFVFLLGSLKNKLQRGGGEDLCYCACIGRDRILIPRWHCPGYVTGYVGADGYPKSMVMEVCTIAGSDSDSGDWREIEDDLPYPADAARAGRCVGGFMFWFLTKRTDHDQPRPRGILHLSLADEKFGITGLPDCSLPLDDDDDACSLALDVLGGGRELCLTAWAKDETMMLHIWTLPVAAGQWEWQRRLAVRTSGLYHPMAMMPCSSSSGGGVIMLRLDEEHTIFLYDLKSSELTPVCNLARIRYQGRKGHKWKHLINFLVVPFTESLLPVRSPKSRRFL